MMEDRTFLTNNHPTNGISDPFRQFIEALVEEVVINGEPFDAQKKWLRKHSEAEGVDYEALERNLNVFFDIIKEWHELHTKSSEMMARMLAKECHLSDTALQALFDHESQKVGTGANGHEYVDLGLPSGTLWATCNIGADKPEDYGNYYSWDEGRTAATRWGNGWDVPSIEQWNELQENTKSTWTTRNGVNGRLFTANNGNNIFLPAAGGRWDDKLSDSGEGGLCWSSSPSSDPPVSAWNFYFNSGYYRMYHAHGRYEFTVRPVRQN